MSRVGETGVGEMGIGETGVGEMGVGETGPNQRKAQPQDCIELLMLLYTGSYEPLCHAFYIGSIASRLV